MFKEQAQKQKQRSVKTSTQVIDKFGTPIFEGNFVKAVKKGKFLRNEGTVKKIRKWVTFEDVSGDLQIRALYNLIVYNVRNRRDTGCSPSGK